MAMPELSWASLIMPPPSAAMFSTGVPLAQRMFSDLFQTMAKSRYGTAGAGGVTVALARDLASSVQVEPIGCTTIAPARPFCGCLMMSAGVRLRPPNSTAVALMLSTVRPSWVTGRPSRSRWPA
ncbi:hypothetical protein D3C76_766080 [compost metagenome]